MPTLLVHVANEDPILGEVDDIPQASDVLIYIKNPRRRDGKDIHYIEPAVTLIGIPFWRINFFEVMPSTEEEDIISFVRE
ncbi:MAG TPA: hypothetical protein PKH92_04290 [Anaerolineaceae bacterium]|nr:hypothetical protein [Anaerolineaceae bacterium]HNZ12253.1 hypothetical protein [Anaerolineaceae bacterium]HOD04244.1 hypothetical protein [Anaerolineaceae bacterium]HOG78606.1 hypothetical protein [Anaerolineaceae bacterium]HQN43999.1 hypothetical protein [Anaerolineaceae bacterium]